VILKLKPIILALYKMPRYYPIALLFIFALTDYAVAGEVPVQEKKTRPYYEYPGNYREQINKLKENFKRLFGHE